MTTSSSKDGATLAERFLQKVSDDHVPISLYLSSGFQLKGYVVGFDQETLLFKHKDVHQHVMRQAIASMYPLPQSENSKEQAGE